MQQTEWSREFSGPPGGAYLLSHSVGCLPKSAAACLEAEYLQPWRLSGGDAWPDWLAAMERFRCALAQFLGGAAADYCPQANVSSGLSKLLAALPAPRQRHNVLLASEQSFPSLVFALGKAEGYTVRLIPGDSSPANLANWRNALAAGDVAAALITHVHSNTGILAPVAPIAAACREAGASSIVDIAQSAGVLGVDVGAFGADAVLGSCVKWLCGGPGAGFMWLRPGLVESLAPIDVGWFSHAQPFEFDPRHFEYARDALRFWGGTPSIAPFVLAAASMRLLSRIGISEIRAHNMRLQRALGESVESARSFVPSDTAGGGTCCIPLGEDRHRIETELRRHGMRFDIRGTTLRASFHVYNTEQDALALARVLNG